MKIPLSLIQSYLPSLDLSVEKITEKLIHLGIEVDAIINQHPPFAKVIVGQIISVQPHPDANKLQIAQVHNGKEVVQVVCGAPNCRAGLKTAFAVPGSTLIDTKGNHLQIKKASLRGVDSFGMLCGAEELHLWKESSGILELPESYTLGEDLCSLLWDPIFEISLTPNLGHCFSALGIARELAAATETEIVRNSYPLSVKGAPRVDIQIDSPELAPLYMGQILEKITVQPSPFWLQKELHYLGIKPINNVVDVTNYLLMKTGHPMHAFDFDKIEGSVLKLGPAKGGETWKGLDELERQIPKGVLVLSDQKKTLSIAGVLGGESSSIRDETTTIFLEAAFFDPLTIRKGAKSLGLRTDSSIRFEKGIDPNGVEEALAEAISLLKEVAGGTLFSKTIDRRKGLFPRKQIPFRFERANHLLGTNLSKPEMEGFFKRLDCTLSGKEGNIIEPPTYRFDLNEEIDLIEEVVRLYGYNNVKRGLSRSISSQLPHDPIYLFEKKVRERLISFGLQEFLTSDLISPRLHSLTGNLGIFNDVLPLKAVHAKTEEYSILRSSLFPGLLQLAKTNHDLKNQNFSGFEIGRIHFLQSGKPVEVPMVSLLLSGKEGPNDWDKKPKDCDFYTLKGYIENLFTSLSIENISFISSNHLNLHPGRQSDLRAEDLVLGSFGEIHPAVLEMFDLKEQVFFAEIHMGHLMSLENPVNTFRPIPNLPGSERDWTLSLKEGFEMGTLFTLIKKHQPPLLESFSLIDLYQGKNATFRFFYRDPLKTISSDEVESIHTQLISKLLSEISC